MMNFTYVPQAIIFLMQLNASLHFIQVHNLQQQLNQLHKSLHIVNTHKKYVPTRPVFDLLFTNQITFRGLQWPVEWTQHDASNSILLVTRCYWTVTRLEWLLETLLFTILYPCKPGLRLMGEPPPQSVSGLPPCEQTISWLQIHVISVCLHAASTVSALFLVSQLNLDLSSCILDLVLNTPFK